MDMSSAQSVLCVLCCHLSCSCFCLSLHPTTVHRVTRWLMSPSPHHRGLPHPNLNVSNQKWALHRDAQWPRRPLQHVSTPVLKSGNLFLHSGCYLPRMVRFTNLLIVRWNGFALIVKHAMASICIDDDEIILLILLVFDILCLSPVVQKFVYLLWSY